jgi:hypothetical protein
MEKISALDIVCIVNNLDGTGRFELALRKTSRDI